MAGGRRAAGFGWGHRLWQPVSSRNQPRNPYRSRLTAHFPGRGLFPAGSGASCDAADNGSALSELDGCHANPGVVTILNRSGDSISAQAQMGNGPLGFALDSTGAKRTARTVTERSARCRSRLSLQTNKVASSTLLADAVPINSLAVTGTQYVVEQGRNAIAAMAGNPPALKQELFVAPSVINMAGVPARSESTRSARVIAGPRVFSGGHAQIPRL